MDEKFVEAAILWLAKAILESLLSGKLEWLAEAGLADETRRLKSEIQRVEMMVAALKGSAIGNNPLARSLGHLKELLYDADDVLDELDYYRLEQQVASAKIALQIAPAEEQESTNGDGTELVVASKDYAYMPSDKIHGRRSTYWREFNVITGMDGKPLKAECIHCNTLLGCEASKGTSVLRNHLRSESCKRKQRASDQPPDSSSFLDVTAIGAAVGTGNSGGKKRVRTNELTHNTAAANTYTWNKAEISNRIQYIALKLRDVQEAVIEFVKYSVPNSMNHQSTTSYPCLRTSCLTQCEVYGRSAEKDSIINLMKAYRSGAITVVPIVGIPGVGKTALAQFAYNYSDPDVKNLFDHRIWVWVSNDFDELRLMKEMLDFVSDDRHEGITSFAKLQEILKRCINSKRFMLILDDVPDDMDDYRWNQLLAPFKSESGVIIVTTRSLAVAKMVGTVEPIKLGSLENDKFWLLFKASAFGDEKYEDHLNLSSIGRQIAQKLKGNPLAAKSVGKLLRQKLSNEHWVNILMHKDWELLQLIERITPALKLSYDRLPYHLHQCFSFCSIFPYNHQFSCEDLVHSWISQGFVKCRHSSERLEDIGQGYLTDLVNLGFFEKIEKNESIPGNQTCYVMCGIMYDFAKLVSRTECATIRNFELEEIPPTVRHLSIVTDSVCHKVQHGIIFRHKRFGEKLQNVFSSFRKLRTLVLIGNCDYSFIQSFKDIIQKSRLRLLKISGMGADDVSVLCNLVNYTHLRYLKLKKKEDDGSLPQVLSKFYHLQVLDIGQVTVPNANVMNGLVSMRHLVVRKEAHIRDQNSIYLTQLQYMSELVQLDLCQLESASKAEAYGATLKGKQFLEKLQLSWNLSNNSPSFEHFKDTAQDVLEALEPHHNLKHLQISGYIGDTSPSWLATSVTCLQTLHIDNCGNLQVLPPLERLSFLRRLKLKNMQKVVQVSIPSSLEELVLIDMPNLKRLSCSSVRDLNSSLMLLKIERCHVLECHDLALNGIKEIFSGFTSLEELTILDCTSLLFSCVNKDTEDNQTDGRLLFSQSLRKLSIACSLTVLQPCFPGIPTRLQKLEVSKSPALVYLQLHFSTTLEYLIIEDCQFLTELGGLQALKKLRYLQVFLCDALPPCLERLSMQSSELCPRLEKLKIDDLHILTQPFCMHLTRLQCLEICTWVKEVPRLTDEQEEALRNLTSLQDLQFRDCRSLVELPVCLHSLTSLRRLEIDSCLRISRLPEKGLPSSLNELDISHCSQALNDLCRRMLATSKLKVKINEEYIN